MKRYELLDSMGLMVENPEGEWVKWEDVEPFIPSFARDLINPDNYYVPYGNAEKPIAPPKVFCKECEYLETYHPPTISRNAPWNSGECGEHMCSSPQNISDSWYEPCEKYALSPQERNKHNDCSLFKRKGE